MDAVERYTIDEAARLVKVSRRTIMRAIAAGRLKVGRTNGLAVKGRQTRQGGVRITAAAINRWLDH